MREKMALTLRVPGNIHQALREIAFYSKRSMNDLAVEALEKQDWEAFVEQAKRKYEEVAATEDTRA